MSSKKNKSPGIVLRMFQTDADGGRREVPVPPMSGKPTARVTGEHVRGSVEVWNAEQGWGVVGSDRTPGGCWVHYSDVIGSGFRSLTIGQQVDLEFEDLGAKYPGGNQDGYRYRAISVTP
ncbi:cold shock domain-containing protein [Rhodococcus sp. G-MC3]|uniref:cold shock domain-containing protein n=1 Tax=Rhodococcus sp. G-MC3 TaxID=3046209 RepID=UPI0024BA0559|nr:cold shock domain-containing protein [Rhodococcus sp. G-MC3]MDJ0396553.1 cold shock domain-containing protein [Rhodococcus sp. G-MC3]